MVLFWPRRVRKPTVRTARRSCWRSPWPHRKHHIEKAAPYPPPLGLGANASPGPGCPGVGLGSLTQREGVRGITSVWQLTSPDDVPGLCSQHLSRDSEAPLRCQAWGHLGIRSRGLGHWALPESLNPSPQVDSSSPREQELGSHRCDGSLAVAHASPGTLRSRPGTLWSPLGTALWTPGGSREARGTGHGAAQRQPTAESPPRCCGVSTFWEQTHREAHPRHQTQVRMRASGPRCPAGHAGVTAWAWRR